MSRILTSSLLACVTVHLGMPVERGKRSATTKIKRTELWHFLLECLSDLNSKVISWEGNYGEFRILEPERLAKMWGVKSGRPKMTYQIMSRALRHYYTKGILSKVKHKKWCYCFSPEALKDNMMETVSYPFVKAHYNHPRADLYQVSPYSINDTYSRGYFPNSWSLNVIPYHQHEVLYFHDNFNTPLSSNFSRFSTSFYGH